jgi:hypothetical protein
MNWLAVVLLSLTLTAGCQMKPAVKKIVDTTYRIEFSEGECSGTAVGRHALLTAEHCDPEAKATEIVLEGKTVKVLGRLADGSDHLVLFLDKTFDKFAVISLRHVEIGESVLFAGAPGDMPLLLRQGIVAGLCDTPDYGSCFELQSAIYFGDSGAGIFDANGRVVSSVSMAKSMSGDGHYIQFGRSFNFRFSRKDVLHILYGRK